MSNKEMNFIEMNETKLELALPSRLDQKRER